MALDSRSKRASALGVGRPFIRSHGIDGTKGQGWRQNSGMAYFGNLVGVAAKALQYMSIQIGMRIGI